MKAGLKIRYYWRLIESHVRSSALLGNPGVSRHLLDDTRFIKYKGHILRVNNVTDTTRQAAVDFALSQYGKNWALQLFSRPTSSDVWMCSTLVWASYKNQGVDIAPGSGGVLPASIFNSNRTTAIVSYAQPLNQTYNTSIVNGVLQIDSPVFTPSSTFAIPSQIGPNNVSRIGGNAFVNCTNLVECTIPNSVTIIGNNAFKNNTLVKWQGNFEFRGSTLIKFTGNQVSYTIPGFITAIDSYAFYSCKSLTSITIPNTVTSIGYRAFEYCSNLVNIEIPNSVTSIGSYAFADSGLTGITIPNSVTSINSRVFYNCLNLTNITIPNNVTSIGDFAFSSCKSLKSITIPNSVTSIGQGTFWGCRDLKNIAIPNSVTSIGNSVFAYSGLTSITIPNSVKSIGDYAFMSSSLTSIILGDGVTNIGKNAFAYSYMVNLTIPDNVTYIDYGAFDGCSNLTSVLIGNGLDSISNRQFAYCTSLINIEIPDNITSIGDSSFEGSGLESIVIPNSITNIGGAFIYCLNLTSVVIESSTINITSNPFLICPNLTSIIVPSDNTVYKSDGNCLIRKSDNVLMLGCKSSVIPLYITSIGDYAFATVGITGIGDYAFTAADFVSITIPDSVSSIGDYAFALSTLTSIMIPDSVMHIGNFAFWECQNLTAVIIQSLYPQVFNPNAFDLFNLANIDLYIPIGTTQTYVDAGWGGFNIIEITEMLDIYDSFFNNDQTLLYTVIAPFEVSVRASMYGYLWTENFYIPDYVIGSDGVQYKVTMIEDYAFMYCWGITGMLTIPDTIVSIGAYAFAYCDGITGNLVIPSSVKTIEEGAFMYCVNLSVEVSEDVEIGYMAFEGVYELIIIYNEPAA